MIPLMPVSGMLAAQPALTSLATPITLTAAPTGPGFAQVLRSGLDALDTKLQTADGLVRRFALGEAVPVHQVTYALEEARLSMELAMQVRGRLLDGYRELMSMQL